MTHPSDSPDRSQPTTPATPLRDKHLAMEARMSEEAGWLMPLNYHSVLDEVATARDRAVVCDVSHIGRIRIKGDEALDLLEDALCTDVAHQEDDSAELTAMLDDQGGMLDLGLLARLPDEWLLTTSPMNRLKVLDHLKQLADGRSVKIVDRTEATAQIAVVGPAAAHTLDKVLPEAVSSLPRGSARAGSYTVARYIALRTGLTSLWSLEVIVPKMLAGQAWTYITRKAGENALVPMGLAGRDVLRIEAGLPRYGHEINETIDPLTAGLEGLLDESRSYRGASAVADLRAKGSGRRTVGLRIETPERTDSVKIPRRGSRVLDDDGVDVGTVTSGTFSPKLGAPLVLAQLASRCLAQESPLRVDVGGQVRFARRVELPVR